MRIGAKKATLNVFSKACSSPTWRKPEQDVHNSADALDDFSAEGTFWLNDRHFNAFLHATHASEENAVTYSAMADHLCALFDSHREKAKKAAKPAS